MNTFSKLYDTELHNQEIKSNKRTLMGFCWFFLTLLLVWVLTMINFFLISKFLISLSLGFTVLPDQSAYLNHAQRYPRIRS